MKFLPWISGLLLAQEGQREVAAFPALLLGLVCLVVAAVGAVVLGVVLVRSGRGGREVVQTCPYCGTHLRGQPARRCSNCGAALGPP